MADKTFTVQRSTTIPAPAATVHALLNDFAQWRKWSPWENLDPQLKRDYSGAASGVGAVYTWSGNRKAGKGRMEITASAAPTSVVVALDFDKPVKSRNTTRFTLDTDGAATTVTWTMTGPATLFTKAAAFFGGMDKLIGNDFERGLAQLSAAAQAE